MRIISGDGIARSVMQRCIGISGGSCAARRGVVVIDSHEVIRFTCEVNKVQTLADGGIRVMLDMPESAVETMAVLAYCKANGIALQAELRAENQKIRE